MSASIVQISIVIPTYGRDEVLVQTIEDLLKCDPLAMELLVIDQTPQHAADTEQRLHELHDAERIRWIRQSPPSITRAMNRGLMEARSPIVLFVDDDIVPASGLLGAHAVAHEDGGLTAVVGQVIQPWQQPADVAAACPRSGLLADLDFPFFSTRADDVYNVMAGNLSVKRDHAIACGGFDENFVGAAYRFETEFARRILNRGGRIRFAPSASLKHLRSERGGTRSQGSHLTSADPVHGVGDYYFALLHGWRVDVIRYVFRRMIREVCTKFHLRHPWYIPVKLVGEVRALCWAWQLHRRGPALIRRPVP